MLSSKRHRIYSHILLLFVVTKLQPTRSDRILKFAMVGDADTNKDAMLNLFSDDAVNYPYVTNIDFVSSRALRDDTIDVL